MFGSQSLSMKATEYHPVTAFEIKRLKLKLSQSFLYFSLNRIVFSQILACCGDYPFNIFFNMAYMGRAS